MDVRHDFGLPARPGRISFFGRILKGPNRLLHPFKVGMCIAKRGLNATMAENFHDIRQADPPPQCLRYHDRRGRMAQAVKGEVADARQLPYFLHFEEKNMQKYLGQIRQVGTKIAYPIYLILPVFQAEIDAR